jgi:hypothetical protein
MLVHGCLRDLEALHAYLHHQELALATTTTNAVEAMAQILTLEVRCLRTPAALAQWASSFVRVRP